MENNEKETIEEGMLYAESVFGRESLRGFVRLSYGITFELLISPEEARFFAMSILEAATAAETDEILITWLKNTVGLKEENKLQACLVEFRNIRMNMRRRELREAKAAGTENKP